MLASEGFYINSGQILFFYGIRRKQMLKILENVVSSPKKIVKFVLMAE